MGQVPATQDQLDANPASEDTFSSLPLPLQFSSPGSQMSAPGELVDDCHGAGPCDTDPSGHQLCQCICRYVSVPVLSTHCCTTGKVVNQSSLQRVKLHHL